MNSPIDLAREVQRLEPFAARSPGAYRLRVAGLAAVGYLFLGALMACVLALIGLLVAAIWFGKGWALIFLKKAFVPVILLAWLLAKALWVRMEAPAGVRLARDDAPKLFDVLEGMRASTGGPRIHRVVVDTNFNCGVVQRPRLGLFGWMENNLIIGLPFALAVGPDELKSVLAHEYGHLSGNHGRFGAWIYRLRRTWSLVQDAFDRTEGWGGRIVARFLDWYAPRFNAYTFVLARQQEYEADRVSAELVGAPAAANALLLAAVRSRDVSRAFWPRFDQETEKHERPTLLPFDAMRAYLGNDEHAETARRFAAEALSVRTEYADTHPCIADRLKALGIEANTDVVLPKHAAGESLLMPSLPRLVALFDREWVDGGGLVRFADRHAEHQAATRRLQELDQMHEREPLTGGTAYERATLVAALRPDVDAAPLFEEVLAGNPDTLGPMIVVSRLRLRRDDPTGIELAERAFQQDRRTVTSLADEVMAYAERSGQTTVLECWRGRVREYSQAVDAAVQERRRLLSRDPVKAHSLSESEVAAVAAACRGTPAIRAAWIAEKVVAHFPERPFVIVAVKTRWWRRFKGAAFDKRIATALNEPASFATIRLDRNWRSLVKRIRTLDNARIFTAEG